MFDLLALTAVRPKRSYAQRGVEVRYVLLSGRMSISHAERLLTGTANAHS